MLSRCFLDFFCRCKGFCHRAESDLFLFSVNIRFGNTLCIPIGLLKMAVKEVLCKRTLYFQSFLTKANCNHRKVGGYMSFIRLSFRHEASFYVWL